MMSAMNDEVPVAMVRPTRFDMIIYHLFWWRWNRILAARPDLWDFIVRHGQAWRAGKKGL
jgi:hypothetical protein